MAQKQRRFERKAHKKRNARKNFQPQAAVKCTDRRDLAEQQQEKELQPADEHVESRDHERTEPRQTQLAERAVGGKQQRGGDDLQKAAQADLEVRRIEDQENADDLHTDGQQMVLFQRLMQDEVRQRHGKHGIARIDDRCSRGVHMQHRHLQKRHVQRHRQETEQRKVAPVRLCEPDVPLFEVVQRKGHQRSRAEQHALDRHLHGRKCPAERLERDLRGRIEHRGKQDIEISPFPIRRHLLPPVPRLWRSSIIVCPAALKSNQNRSVRVKNAALQSRTAF